MTTTLDEERLTEIFSALANPTRRALLARLAEGEATVNELAEPFNMTLPAVSKHLKVLEKAGLVVRGRQAQFRPCALDAEPLREVSSWTDQYRHVWEARLDRMESPLEQPRPKKEGNTRPLPRTSERHHRSERVRRHRAHLRRTCRGDLADVDRSRALHGLVRPDRREHHRRRDGRAGGWRSAGVHGDADTQRPRADV